MPPDRGFHLQVNPEIVNAAGIGTGVYHQNPEDLVTNDVLAPTILTKGGNLIDNDFILKRTHIRERFHVKGKDAVAKMGSDALTEALERKGWTINDLDFLIVTTSWDTQDSTADKIYKLQLGETEQSKKPQLLHVFADCSGFTQTLHELNNKREIFEGMNIAIVASEQYSPHTADLDKAIFGDHAAAFVGKFGSAPDADFDVLGSYSKTYEEECKKICMRVPKPSAYIQSQLLFFLDLPYPEREDDPDFVMEGQAVFQYSLSRENLVSVHRSLEQANLTLPDIDMVYTHQANGRITEGLGRQFRQKGSKEKTTVEYPVLR